MTYSEQMLDHIEEGAMDQAQKDFAWALRKDDDDTLYSLAEELYALGLTNQAQRTYLKLLDRYPQEDELRTALAEIAIDNGDNDEALSYLSQIQPSSPAYLQSLLVQADLYQTEEQFEITEAKLNEAYRMAPDEPAVLFALAEYYYLIGKFQEAIPFYFALIKAGHLEFAKVDIAGRLGTAYAQLGKFDQALGYLKQVAPGYQTSDIRFQTGLTQLALHQLKEAIITFKELAEDDGQYASVYPALAQAYAEEHHYAQALTTLQEGLGEYMAKIKDEGLLVKLDTNGTRPDVIRSLIDDHLVDYIAMDVKNSIDSYAATVGIKGFDPTSVMESITLLKEGRVDYEFRTTVTKETHKQENFIALASLLEGAKAYYLQNYVPNENTIEKGNTPLSYDELQNYIRILRKTIGNVKIRNI